LRETVGIRDKPVEEGVVERAVDEPGAGALQLVAHPAGAPDCTLSGSSYDATARRNARPSWRQRRPDGGGYWTTFTANGITRNGPGRGLSAHQRQRHGEAVVDVHPVDDGEVEVVLDQRLREVRGEFRMPLDRRHRPRSPALRRRARTRRRKPIANVGIISRLNADAWSL